MSQLVDLIDKVLPRMTQNSKHKQQPKKGFWIIMLGDSITWSFHAWGWELRMPGAQAVLGVAPTSLK